MEETMNIFDDEKEREGHVCMTEPERQKDIRTDEYRNQMYRGTDYLFNNTPISTTTRGGDK